MDANFAMGDTRNILVTEILVDVTDHCIIHSLGIFGDFESQVVEIYSLFLSHWLSLLP
jgi:hypothetical protein